MDVDMVDEVWDFIEWLDAGTMADPVVVSARPRAVLAVRSRTLPPRVKWRPAK